MYRTYVSRAALGRLPEYLRTLKELPAESVPYISATTISKRLNLGEVQVRKDLAAVSGEGRPKLGYETSRLIDKLEEALGCGQQTPAVLVGAGKLGRALLKYRGFDLYGLRISAAFDSDEEALRASDGAVVLPMSEFRRYCKKHRIKLGIITVGAEAAQEVCDLMVGCGIEGIWNFAPRKLEVPGGVIVQNEKLALSLAHLKFQLSIQDQEDTRWTR